MERNMWKEFGEAAMPENTLFTLKNTKIVCQKCIGRGSSCLVYQGYIPSGSDIIENTDVIIKEFYPKSEEEVFEIERNPQDGMLRISERTKQTAEYKNRMEQFLTGISNQKRLSKSDAMEIAVKPWIEGALGDSYYVVSNCHKGTDLSRANLDTLEKKLLVAISVAETMDILHAAGFLMLDIKPENLFWTQSPSMVRIIDVDSIIDKEDILSLDKTLISNLRYASPEMQLLSYKLRDQISDSTLRNNRMNLLQVDSNIYSMGIYLHELFWGTLPSSLEEIVVENLISSFEERYAEAVSDADKLKVIAQKLTDIISKTVIRNRTKRRCTGYQKAEALMKDLNEIYAILSSEKYIPRKEIAKANGTFAAYHMLHKYPLFRYRIENKEEEYKLEVVITGRHVMRKDMVSAIISIGQMLDTRLHIYLAGKDAEQFWLQYSSEQDNPGITDAVLVSKNGKAVSDSVNPYLVSRPLAHIHLITKDSKEAVHNLIEQGTGRYFIVLEEEHKKKKDVCQYIYDDLSLKTKDGRYFIGYLHEEEETVSAKHTFADVTYGKEPCIDVFPISSDSYNEVYNENMFEYRIYKMGLMAYAYYCGIMEEEQVFDMDMKMDYLEKEFKKDMYGIASSERAALHSIYKIESLGILQNKPGRFLNYYRKLQEPQCLEQLAWLEHQSWTAYILTSGGVPVFTKEEDFTDEGFTKLFEEYAYLDDNDWKDKRDKNHLRHPFLAAYYLDGYIKPDKGWLNDTQKWTEEKAAMLDPLDMLSWRLNCWYRKKVSEYKDRTDKAGLGSENCILSADKNLVDRQESLSMNYEKLLKDAKKERDIKQSDRNMVFAAVDMIV